MIALWENDIVFAKMLVNIIVHKVKAGLKFEHFQRFRRIPSVTSVSCNNEQDMKLEHKEKGIAQPISSLSLKAHNAHR